MYEHFHSIRNSKASSIPEVYPKSPHTAILFLRVLQNKSKDESEAQYKKCVAEIRPNGMKASSSDKDDQMLPSIDELPGVAASAPAGVTIGASNEGQIRKSSWSDGSVDLTSFDDIFKNGAKDELSSSDNAEQQSPLISRQNYKSHGATENGSFDNIFGDANDEGAANSRQQKEEIGQPNGTEKEQANNGAFDDAFDDVFNIDNDQRASNQATNQQNLQARQPDRNDDEAIFDVGSINNVFDADDIANKYVEQQNPPTRSQEKSEDNQSIDNDPLENEFNDTNHQEVPIQAARHQLSKTSSEHQNATSSSVNSLNVPATNIPSVNTNAQYNSSLEASLAAIAPMYNIRANSNTIGGIQNNAPEIQAKSGLSAIINQSQASADRSVIELLDDDDDYNDAPVVAPNKRKRLDHLTNGSQQQSDPAAASAAARNQHMPEWMNQKSQPRRYIPRQPAPIQRPRYATMSTIPGAASIQSIQSRHQWHEPSYINLPPDFVPTWETLFPVERVKKQEFKSFELSLLNVQEFTITGLAVKYEGPPSSVTGLRLKIKEISKPHGKAVFDKDKEGYGGKWRIPLLAYRSFFSYLNSDPMIRVVGIPENQLKIASLGKARLERGFPSTQKIMSKGVPKGLAKALAPFQRGGVDFVAERGGRALIADDMGLGKTIQAIASLTMYYEEWPVLVLTPSTARYHWENEFQHWLGIDSPVNKDQESDGGLNLFADEEEDNKSDDDTPYFQKTSMPLLKDSQIHVLTSSKDDIIPNESTRVVVCSYGLAPALVESGKITPAQFRCVIVDESHMLKNMATKRTSRLVPILHATNRCILLSGTPALARPSELFPQLKILSTEKDTWWEDEDSFVDKYVKRSSPARRAELYAMLTGTVMIRRLKSDILKSMPNKIREKAVNDVSTPEQRKEFHECMVLLREGKGVMGKLARQHSALDSTKDAMASQNDGPATVPNNELNQKNEEAKVALVQEYHRRHNERMSSLQHTLATTVHQLNPVEQQNFIEQQDYELRRELDAWYKERLHELDEEQLQLQNPELTRKSALNRMYILTAKSKVPLIADMIKRWLKDPTKGKLCVFAHHIFVLDDLIRLVGLSNANGSGKNYIRIDGSTAPKTRQAQIKSFQTDPDVKIAILGITAAGVAVTLTASSTVWFAELFWTPALMIQAEDRCHRIGQNSQVKCLYFLALGTLDELLWKLLEKKFRDLGEFVEGREKMKIVVQKTYNGEKDLHSMFSVDDEDPLDATLNLENIDEDSDRDTIFDLDNDLEGDITMLAKEELTMMLPEGDDDEADTDTKVDSGNQAQPNNVAATGVGASEEDAILLSDDEDEKPPATASTAVSEVGTPIAQAQAAEAQPAQPADQLYQNCRFYNLLFDGPSFGMQLHLHQDRPVVSRKINTSQEKPAFGDILVAANGLTLPPIQNISQVINHLKNSMMRGSVELTFAEHDGFSQYFQALAGAENARLTEAQRARQNQMLPSSQGSGEVIELLDDD